jgi:acetyltransferase-like isoleucine patch superfamily enzyme
VLMKLFCKDLLFFVINNIVCWMPSRSVRSLIYWTLSRGSISLKANVGLGVKFLDIRNIKIGDHSNIGFGSILDGRGAILYIGRNVDVAPQVNIWTLQHDVGSESHQSVASKVRIEDSSWICNRALILPGSFIRTSAVVAAGAVFKGELPSGMISTGLNGRIIDKRRCLKEDFKLSPLRRFR